MENQIRDKYYSTGQYDGYVRSSISTLSNEYGLTPKEIRRIIMPVENINVNGQNYLSTSTDLVLRAPFHSLPENFGNFKSLTDLSLQSTMITSLPETFGNLKSLTILKIHYNNQLTSLPETFGNLKSLRRLEVFMNKNFTRLPESFGNLKSLTEFMFLGNKCAHLPESFGNLKSLETLLFQDSLLKTLPKSFPMLKKLITLTLSADNLTSLPDNFGNLQSLTTFELSSNQLIQLPESFSKLKKLMSLHFGNTDIKVSSKLYDTLQSKFILPANVSRMEANPFAIQDIEKSLSADRVKSYLKKALEFSRLLNDPVEGQNLQQGPENIPTKLKRAFTYYQQFKTAGVHHFLIPALNYPTVRYALTSTQFQNGKYCFDLLISKYKADPIFTNIIEIVYEGTLDAGGPRREFFSSIGTYLKTLLSYDEDMNVYKFKYETPLVLIKKIAIIMTIALCQKCALNIPFSSGIIYLWKCGFTQTNFAKTMGSHYIGKLMYLLDVNTPGSLGNPDFMIAGCPSGSAILLNQFYANELNERQELVSDHPEKLHTEEVLLFVFKREAERSLFYGKDTWGVVQQEHITWHNRMVEDGDQSEKLYLLWDAFIKGVSSTPLKKPQNSNIDLDTIKSRLGVNLTRDIMLNLDIQGFTPQLRGFYTDFIQETSKSIWEAFLKWTSGSGIPHRLEINVLYSDDADERLPAAHTCNYIIDMPNYSTKDIFREKIMYAINESSGFTFM